MNILGLSAFYHDSAACLVRDGDIIAAAQEERFSRKKHDYRFPKHAIDYCLREADLDPGELDFVAFYDKPLLKFDRLLETYLAYAPVGFRSFLSAMPLWLRQKLHLPREMDRGLQRKYKGRYVFCEHHESHAASAFFASPFEQAAILTLDGVGEWATATYGVGRGNRSVRVLERLVRDGEIRWDRASNRFQLATATASSYLGTLSLSYRAYVRRDILDIIEADPVRFTVAPGDTPPEHPIYLDPVGRIRVNPRTNPVLRRGALLVFGVLAVPRDQGRAASQAIGDWISACLTGDARSPIAGAVAGWTPRHLEGGRDAMSSGVWTPARAGPGGLRNLRR